MSLAEKMSGTGRAHVAFFILAAFRLELDDDALQVLACWPVENPATQPKFAAKIANPPPRLIDHTFDSPRRIVRAIEKLH